MGTLTGLADCESNKERQNESYLEATVRTECCTTVTRRRRVGEHRGRPTLSRQRRLGIARSLSRSTRLALAFFGKALVERTKIDHHALMSSAADLFHLVARRDLKFDSFSLDLDYLGFGTNIMTYGCSGKMPYIYRGCVCRKLDSAILMVKAAKDRS
jgi:hypothetical protein